MSLDALQLEAAFKNNSIRFFIFTNRMPGVLVAKTFKLFVWIMTTFN